MKPMDGKTVVRPTFYPEMKEREMTLDEFRKKVSKLNRKKKWYISHLRYRDNAYKMLVTHGERQGVYTPGWQMNVHEEFETNQRDILVMMDRSGTVIPCAWKYYDLPNGKKKRKVTLDDWL